MDEKTQAVINLQQLIAGFIGAIIMVLKAKDKRNIWTNVASVISARRFRPQVDRSVCRLYGIRW